MTIGQENAATAIVIDLKKGRIRIYKRTLHLLGNPQYIQLLVNPESRIIAIQCSSPADNLSYFINWKMLASKQSCELYSRNLVQTLHRLCPELQTNRAYRIYGEILPEEKIATFQIQDCVELLN